MWMEIQLFIVCQYFHFFYIFLQCKFYYNYSCAILFLFFVPFLQTRNLSHLTATQSSALMAFWKSEKGHCPCYYSAVLLSANKSLGRGCV